MKNIFFVFIIIINFFGSVVAMEKKEHPCKRWWDMVGTAIKNGYIVKEEVSQVIAQAKAAGCNTSITVSHIEPKNIQYYKDAGAQTTCTEEREYIIIAGLPHPRITTVCQAIIDFSESK